MPDYLEKNNGNTEPEVSNIEKNIKNPTVFKAQETTGLTSDELIEFSVFENIRSIFNAKFYNLISDYLEDSDDYIKSIDDGINNNNFDLVRENAHPLKSSSFTLGFIAVGNFAKNIEFLAKDKKDIELINKEYHTLIIRYKETLNFINEFKSKNMLNKTSQHDDYSEGK